MKTDVYQTITNKIVAALEKGVGEYPLPWRRSEKFSLPKNVSSHKNYRGINCVALFFEAMERGFENPHWGTYRQWNQLGAQVRKGEKSSVVVFWKGAEAKTQDPENEQAEKAAGNVKSQLWAAYSYVFNAEQVDGYDKGQAESDRVPELENYFSSVGADVRHGGDKAFFSVKADFVQMPLFEKFNSSTGYYAVLSHELTHWTGGATRLNREFSKKFGDDAYAFEELVAELGSAFLCGELGLSQDPRGEHASYIETWLKVLKEDKRAIFTAASKAQAAVDFLRERANLSMAA